MTAGTLINWLALKFCDTRFRSRTLDPLAGGCVVLVAKYYRHLRADFPLLFEHVMGLAKSTGELNFSERAACIMVRTLSSTSAARPLAGLTSCRTLSAMLTLIRATSLSMTSPLLRAGDGPVPICSGRLPSIRDASIACIRRLLRTSASTKSVRVRAVSYRSLGAGRVCGHVHFLFV